MVNRETDVTEPLCSLPIWSVDTDGAGVTSATDLRSIGLTVDTIPSTYHTDGSGAIDTIGSNVITTEEIDFPSIVVKQPDRLPIVELRDGESIEIPVAVDSGEVLKVHRWGVFDVSTHSAPPGLSLQLLDGTDTVQVSASTADERDVVFPVASVENTSGSISIFKLRAKNETGEPIDDLGVGSHFGYRVVE